MLLEVVTALAQAGRAALEAVRPGGPCEVSVSQLDQGQLWCPSLAVLRISDHHLKFVHVGADGELREHLLSVADTDGRLAGAQILAEDVLTHLTEALPSRLARSRVEHLALAPVSLGTRGVRSFGVRCRANHGQLFLLADLPSVAETERERGSDTLRAMADSCLTAGWTGVEGLPDTAACGLVDFLRRSESDVHLVFPLADGNKAEKAAVLVDVVDDPEGTRLDFAVPVDTAMRGHLAAGDLLRGRIGVEDRSIDFEMVCRGLGIHTLASGLQLAGLSTGLPRDIRVVQSRRSFRISITDHVDVEIAVADPGPGMLMARLVDLSFSGTCLVYMRSSHEPALTSGDPVHCRMYLPEHGEPVEIPGVVRHAIRSLDESARPRIEVGIEFDKRGIREASGRIRQFVLNQQRSQLARRVQVVRVSDW